MAAATGTEAGSCLHFRFQARPGLPPFPGRQGACAGCPKPASRRARSAAGSAECPLEIKLLTPPPVASSKSATGNSRLSRQISPFCSPTLLHPLRRSALLLFCLPRQASPWAPLCGHGGLPEWSGKRSHGVLSLVVKVTRERLSQAPAGGEGDT